MRGIVRFQTIALGLAITVTGCASPPSADVDAANAALSTIDTQTAFNPTAKTGGKLTGDYTVRELQSSLLSAVSQGQSGYGSFKPVPSSQILRAAWTAGSVVDSDPVNKLCAVRMSSSS